MIGLFALHVTGLLCLVPATLLPLRRQEATDRIFWGSLGLACVGALAVVLVPATLEGGWNTNFSNALWASVATTLVLFSVLCRARPSGWRLTHLVMPYVMGLALLGNIWAGMETVRLLTRTPPFWTMLHIVVALVTYGLLTLAAMAALAGFLQERALKAKRRTPLTRRLPAAAEADDMAHGLLISTEAVLAGGLLSGGLLLLMEGHDFVGLGHKILLSLLAFAVIGGLLIARALWGVRGRLAARLMLLAYLLLTLAFPGIKFVSDFLL